MRSPEATVADPASDILRAERQPLEVFFSPQTVAVVGATEKVGSVGRTILWNLITSPFGGTVYPVNPKRPNVLGVKAYKRIADIPELVDLAVVVTPPPTVPGVIDECAAAGIKAVVIISAGFKEVGPEGVALEQQILAKARAAGIRIVGPNCLGVMCPPTGLNATFGSRIARAGNVAFISQSGALCTAVLDWSLRVNVGFSVFASVGSMLDVDWGDLINYLGNDPRTNSIVIYMESIGDARSFLSAARQVALSKPIIVIKPGRTAGAAKAAASHTGSLTGSDEVLEIAFRRCGVLRVNSIAEVFHMADVLAKQPRPKGPRLTIVTNAGGPGVLACDALITSGGELAEIKKSTIEELNKFLPPVWSHNNPVDVIGDAAPDRYVKTLEVVAKDQNTDGMLVILTPQAMTDPTQTAEALKPYATSLGKPVLASWMGGADVATGQEILMRAGIPTFEYPDTATQMFGFMWRYSQNLSSLYETPSLPGEGDEGAPDREKVKQIIAKVREEKRTILTEFESKEVLAAYGIPTVPTHIATSEDEAAKCADKIGYPIVLKLFSETITHKTDVGGVKLNLANADAVRKAFAEIKKSVTEKVGAEHFLGVTVQPMIKLEGYELILGSSIDPQFGPVLLFGTGGQLVEVFKDRSLGLPPLNTTLARRMMERTKIFTALKGVRGRKPVDLAALEQLLVRFSLLVTEQRWIAELDINPLLASPERLMALDARVVLHNPETSEDQLPNLAIRPYPTQYVSATKIKDGTKITIRPIRPEDEPVMVKFHESLSEETVLHRYNAPLALSQRVTHERLTRICFNDYDREIALVAERKAGRNERTILGVARLSKKVDGETGECSILIADSCQRQGLGKELMQRIVEIARAEKLKKLVARIHPDSAGMLAICKKFGFEVIRKEGDKLFSAEIKL
jgi:acetyltransferase